MSVPPQHGKSTILAEEAASWIIGRFPGINIGVASYSPERVTDISKAVRARVSTALYQEIFPDTQIVFGSNRMDSWRLTNGSTMRAKSVGQKFTGNRLDWVIIDDPHSGRDDAESPTSRKYVQTWYSADVRSRLYPVAAIFIIATRWHPDDLIGHLTSDTVVEELRGLNKEHEVYNVVNIPAICNDEENDPLGRKEGEAAFPEIRDEEFLSDVKATTAAYEWESQYMGNPQAAGGGNVDWNKITLITLDKVPDHLERVAGWDLAVSEAQASDYSVSATIAYDWEQDHLYIIDIFRNRKRWGLNRGVFLKLAGDLQEDLNVQKIAIEAVAGFGSVYSDIKEQLLGELNIRACYPPKGSKMSRALPWFNKIEAGRVFVVIGAWNKEFRRELEVFDGINQDHDDAAFLMRSNLVYSGHVNLTCLRKSSHSFSRDYLSALSSLETP